MLTIGKVASQANVSTDTLRFYEREGLIAPASKSEAGYRLYNADAVRRLQFIKHAQDGGFFVARNTRVARAQKSRLFLLHRCA